MDEVCKDNEKQSISKEGHLRNRPLRTSRVPVRCYTTMRNTETPMTITATQVLQLLAKATKLYIRYDVYEDDGEHFIQFEVDWYADEHNGFSYEKVHISKENESKWGVCWDFDSFMKQLDDKLKEQEQKELKEEKRKALIARLTPEERELLDL